MTEKRIQGVVTALGTPLDGRERLHVEGMRRQIESQIAAGIDALLVLGSMGAMQLLTDETCSEALETTVGTVRGRIPVIVGCGDESPVIGALAHAYACSDSSD